MVKLIKDNLNSILDVCKKHHVRSLYLIGSAARDDKEFLSDSDVDFLYKFNKEKIPLMEYADNFFDFLFSLEALLNRKIDLVPEEKLKNPYLIESINKSKQKLYES